MKLSNRQNKSFVVDDLLVWQSYLEFRDEIIDSKVDIAIQQSCPTLFVH